MGGLGLLGVVGRGESGIVWRRVLLACLVRLVWRVDVLDCLKHRGWAGGGSTCGVWMTTKLKLKRPEEMQSAIRHRFLDET